MYKLLSTLHLVTSSGNAWAILFLPYMITCIHYYMLQQQQQQQQVHWFCLFIIHFFLFLTYSLTLWAISLESYRLFLKWHLRCLIIKLSHLLLLLLLLHFHSLSSNSFRLLFSFRLGPRSSQSVLFVLSGLLMMGSITLHETLPKELVNTSGSSGGENNRTGKCHILPVTCYTAKVNLMCKCSWTFFCTLGVILTFQLFTCPHAM